MSISATVIAYSQAPSGQKIVTWELVYPRFIHGEMLTHRLFSRNAASSRAIPVSKMIDLVRTQTALPVHWGKNQPGMQANEQLSPYERLKALQLWQRGAEEACALAEEMNELGMHKQLVNRVLEPYQMMKTIVTATCLDNFFWLRDHKDAQPEIRALAEAMSAYDDLSPVQLGYNDWHMPYFGNGYWLEGCGIPLEDALAISSSCCAQVSYRVLDDTLEKAHMIYERLVGSSPVHASPFEHQATPIEAVNWKTTTNIASFPNTWEKGITHIDRKGQLWSGNFVGFIQHRQLIDGHTNWGVEV